MNPIIHRYDLAKKVASEVGMDPVDVNRIINFFLSTMEKQLNAGHTIVFRRFGKFVPVVEQESYDKRVCHVRFVPGCNLTRIEKK